MSQPERIGRHTYQNLKNLPTEELTEEGLKAIQDYEEEFKPSDEQIRKRSEYAKKVYSEESQVPVSLDKDIFWRSFIGAYGFQNDREFEVTHDTLENIKPIMYYFLRDKSFFDCERLTDQSKPSFSKGLLIIGGYGNGKSSIMAAIQQVLRFHPELSFALYDANDVVSDYEACGDQSEKDMFWNPLTKGRCFFDDVKTEREASNYGKKNLFKDILEIRCKNNALTHITCNYSNDQEGDLEAGLDEFGHKYGPRVYDRLAQMFNIIEFKGKSFRK